MAVTANDALRDAFIRHQIYLIRYSGSVRNYIYGLLDATEQDIASKIRDSLRNSTAGLGSSADVRKMQKLIQSVQDIRSGVWTDSDKYLATQMESLAQAEPVFAKGIFETNSPVELELSLPPDRQLIGIATSQPFQGRILSEWASTMESDDLRRIQAAIQMGMVAGEDAGTIAKRVVGTGALNGTDGMTEITRRQVQSLVRTAVQHVANETRDTFAEENSDVLDHELFVATLDSRTTAICRALDGKVFEVGDGPRPPLHFGCRSLRVAYFDDNLLGSRPAKAGTRSMALKQFADDNDLEDVDTRDDLPRGSKSKFDSFERKFIGDLTGQVPASVSYNDWLRNQSSAFQDEVLGKTKAQLFRDGGLTLDKYVAANGSELTLSQLADKYPGVFVKAGLDPGKF